MADPGVGIWAKLISPMVKLFRYLNELRTSPARLKALERAVASQADPRPLCTTCGTGRVSLQRSDGPPRYQTRVSIGVCQNGDCAMEWLMAANGGELWRPADHGA